MFNWLRRLLRGTAPKPLLETPSNSRSSTKNAAQPWDGTTWETNPAPPSPDQAGVYLARIHSKIDSLASSYASGNLNRVQFQELYAHYQRELQTVEAAMAISPKSDDWKNATTEGQSILIRHRNRAVVLGFSIYDNNSGLPVRSLGQFKVDPALFVPMLSSYQSATAEIFGGGICSTQIEGGQWLCFVPGRCTTTLALFNQEPSARQLKSLEELQVVFENANRESLSAQPIRVDGLACPHEYYIGHPL